ncbi:MAG: octaprenyl diphosphate synthase, partial [Gammaproteobacteria bacterium SG8_47]
EEIDAIKAAIESTGAIDYTARSARSEADQAVAALACIPDSRYKEALHALTEFAVNRAY